MNRPALRVGVFFCCRRRSLGDAPLDLCAGDPYALHGGKLNAGRLRTASGEPRHRRWPPCPKKKGHLTNEIPPDPAVPHLVRGETRISHTDNGAQSGFIPCNGRASSSGLPPPATLRPVGPLPGSWSQADRLVGLHGGQQLPLSEVERTRMLQLSRVAF
jgi:hypothetical protein